MANRLAEMQLEILWEEIMLQFDKVEIVGEVIQRCRLFCIQKRNEATRFLRYYQLMSPTSQALEFVVQ